MNKKFWTEERRGFALLLAIVTVTLVVFLAGLSQAVSLSGQVVLAGDRSCWEVKSLVGVCDSFFFDGVSALTPNTGVVVQVDGTVLIFKETSTVQVVFAPV